MKLLVIFTGGTIGCTVKDGYISTDNSTTYQLLDMYHKKAQNDISFDSIEPYTLLSENLTGDYMKKLGECVKANLGKGYDGIIITHGTDTLQYSAAALSYYLPEPKLPILLVSSNLVLDDVNANGLANFESAVEFIVSNAGTGVYVSYRNNDGTLYIHKGTRLMPHLPYNDDLFSMGNQYYAIYKDGKIIKNSNYIATESASDTKTPALNLPDSWNSNIKRIFPYPGMDYPTLNSEIQAVLLDTYHSGTLCSLTPNMQSFYNTAKENNIPVFLTGSPNGLDYESVKEWKSTNIFTLPTASPIAMYVKLWMAISTIGNKDIKELQKIMSSPVADEFLLNK